MSETQINPNQILGGGSSKEIKILNVDQTGTLIRNGAVVTGFSIYNYLELGAIVDKGILSLSGTSSKKYFVDLVFNASSWELVFKIKYIAGDEQCLFSDGLPSESQGCYLDILSNGKFQLCLEDDNGVFVNQVEANSGFSNNTDYWIKWSFTGTKYIVAISTDGENYTNKLSVNSSRKITRDRDWKFGTLNIQDNCNLISPLDLSEMYLKVNGEIVWKGVETL